MPLSVNSSPVKALLMNIYMAEFIGTAILILLGNGVVANVVLDKTKGHGAGWIVITAGWACAVFVAVACVGDISGAHLNPAVTLGLALDKGEWDIVPGYLAAQMAGAVLGGILVFVFYQDHYAATKDADAKLATFCTAPSIRSLPVNFLCEAIGTFVLVYAVLMSTDPSFDLAAEGDGGGIETVKIGLGSLGALRVGLIVFSIGLSLGGTTGYAINPARDLGPRLAHFLLPIRGKRDSDWSYAPVPVLGPLAGGVLAAALH